MRKKNRNEHFGKDFGKWSLETFGEKVAKVLRGQSDGGWMKLGHTKVWILSDEKWKNHFTTSWRNRAEKAEQKLKDLAHILQGIGE